MKRHKQSVKFSATPVLIICFIVGLFLIIINNLVIDAQQDQFFKILKSVLDILASTIISIATLNFFITISTEQELVDKIQTRINSSADYALMTDEQLCSIIEAISKEKIKKPSMISVENVPADIDAMSSELAKNYLNTVNDLTYYECYDRRVSITLIDDCIKIKTTTRVVYVNLDKCPDMSFRLQPMFYTENEAKSFIVKKVKYNSINKTESYKKHAESAKIYDAKNNERYKTITPWIIDISNAGKHEIVYTTEYATDYSVFFQTKIFDHICKNFNLSASINDLRTKKQPDYHLRWEIICSPLEKSRIASKRAENDDKQFFTPGGIQWFPKGGGYVLTLNPLYEKKQESV